MNGVYDNRGLANRNMNLFSPISAADAKRVTIQVWKYLTEHPEIKNKCDLPADLMQEIMYLYNQCPLCEYASFKNGEQLGCCSCCPLHRRGQSCFTIGSAWSIWCDENSTDSDREAAARKIWKIAEEWNIDEE